MRGLIQSEFTGSCLRVKIPDFVVSQVLSSEEVDKLVVVFVGDWVESFENGFEVLNVQLFHGLLLLDPLVRACEIVLVGIVDEDGLAVCEHRLSEEVDNALPLHDL